MALRVQAANRPELDQDGFFHGVIANIKPLPSTDKYKAPRFRWTIEGKGTVRAMGFHFTTPSELGEVYEEDELEVLHDQSEAQEEESDDMRNTLATVCLALELIVEADLEPHVIAQTINQLDLEAAKGLMVRCKLAKRIMVSTEGGVERRSPYVAPVLETLTLDR